MARLVHLISHRIKQNCLTSPHSSSYLFNKIWFPTEAVGHFETLLHFWPWKYCSSSDKLLHIITTSYQVEGTQLFWKGGRPWWGGTPQWVGSLHLPRHNLTATLSYYEKIAWTLCILCLLVGQLGFPIIPVCKVSICTAIQYKTIIQGANFSYNWQSRSWPVVGWSSEFQTPIAQFSQLPPINGEGGGNRHNWKNIFTFYMFLGI